MDFFLVASQDACCNNAHSRWKSLKLERVCGGRDAEKGHAEMRARKGHLFFTNTQTPGTLAVTARVLVALVFTD
jgi:hypothetical protein